MFDYRANHARPAFMQSYLPTTINNGAIGGAVAPIQFYVNAQLRI